MARWLMGQWLRKGWFARVMSPLSAVAGAVVRRKHADYASGVRVATRLGVPVVVVGNIFVGGTGKTPVVIALTRALRLAGWTPGILSRGYGVAVGDTPLVGQGLSIDPARFGDEPALLAQATGAALAVHPQRVRAAQALLAQHPDIDVLISDDGLQHLALARDIEVVVQDERGVGNGLLLPSGPLREPPDRLDSVDVIITRCTRHMAAQPSTAVSRSDRPTTPDARPWRLEMTLRPGMARQLTTGTERSLAEFAGRDDLGRLGAAAGIGQPQRFFDMLADHGIGLSATLPLPDHHAFSRSPFVDVAADIIFVTAKDAVKCRKWGDARLWEVPVEAEFSDPCFPAALITQLAVARPIPPECGKLL